MKTEDLYKNRFAGELKRKNEVWGVLCRSFFQKFINKDDVVLDIGAGYCEFINNINCKRKYAVDMNEDTINFAGPDVEVIKCSSWEMVEIADNSINTVFMSNFLEHLKTRDDIFRTLDEVYRVLVSGGRVIILQPNIKYAYKEYWDFIDHYIPLSDKSIVEALKMAGFVIDMVIPRFIPYSTKRA